MAKLQTKAKKSIQKKSIGGLPTIYGLRDYGVPRTVLVVGCGGTGGHLVPHLARMIGVLREKGSSIHLALADGDEVEKKNLIRQNFIMNDLGKNKAEVMAKRYSNAFGFEIVAITKDLESSADIDSALEFNKFGGTSVVIGCVDNNKSRHVINTWFQDNNLNLNRFWIDSGNEEKAGQVVCGFAPSMNYYSNTISDSKKGLFSLPSVFEVYPNLEKEEGKFNSELSCAERAMSAPQNMQTNVTAATVIMNFMQKILHKEVIKSHAVDFSIENVFSTSLNTPENLSKINKNRRRNWEKFYE